MNNADPRETMPKSPGETPSGSRTGETPSLSDLRRSVAEVTRVLYLRRWLFFVPLCLVMTCAFVMSLQVPRRYTHSTTFERRDDPVLVNLPRNEGSGAFVTFQRTLMQDIADAEALQDVVRRLRLVEHDPMNGSVKPDPESEAYQTLVRKHAARIASGLSVRFLQKSEHLDVIEIIYTSDRPERMAAILDEVRDHYIRTTQQRINDLLQQTKSWFEQERHKRRATVESLEDDLIKFRTEHNGLDPLNPDAAVAKLNALNNDLRELENRDKELRAEIDVRREFLSGAQNGDRFSASANSGIDLALVPHRISPEMRRLQSELNAVDLQVADLQTTRGMTDRHPEIVSLNRKRRNLMALLDEESSSQANLISVNGVATAITPFEIETVDDSPLAAGISRAALELKVFEKLQAQNAVGIDQIKNDIAEYEELQRRALVRRKDFSARTAEVDRARRELALYQGYADQVGRVLAAENSQRGILFEKIKPASGSRLPSSPRLSTVVVLALTVGLAASVVLVLISELFDRTIRTRRQVTSALGLPILESIGEIVTTAARRKRFIMRAVLAPAAITCLIVLAAGSGSLAYMSLRDRALYERTISWPQEVFRRVVFEGDSGPPVAQVNASFEEHRG